MLSNGLMSTTDGQYKCTLKQWRTGRYIPTQFWKRQNKTVWRKHCSLFSLLCPDEQNGSLNSLRASFFRHIFKNNWVVFKIYDLALFYEIVWCIFIHCTKCYVWNIVNIHLSTYLSFVVYIFWTFEKWPFPFIVTWIIC